MRKNRETPWLEKLAEAAGDLAMRYYHGGYEVFRKSNDTPVTSADLAVDRFLQERIRKQFPQDCILSEETEDDPNRLHAERVWIIDPIDGTALFIAKMDYFSILIALCVDGIPVECCAHFPALKTTLYSARDAGCYLNGARIRVSQRGLENALISSWGAKFAALDTVPSKMTETNLALIDLARGKLDGCVLQVGRKAGEHDLACAAGAIRDAGGRVTDLDGAPLQFNKPVRATPQVMVCSNGVIHEALLERARLAWSAPHPGRGGGSKGNTTPPENRGSR